LLKITTYQNCDEVRKALEVFFQTSGMKLIDDDDDIYIFMYIHMYIYIYVHIHTRIYIYVCTYILKITKYQNCDEVRKALDSFFHTSGINKETN
jgi:HD superfamily phosphohydrolase